jgi:hypothetical protein
MREHSGVDGMHGRRQSVLFECGPDRSPRPLSSHSSFLKGKPPSAVKPARKMCVIEWTNMLAGSSGAGVRLTLSSRSFRLTRPLVGGHSELI